MSKCIGCEHYLFDEINKCNYCNSENSCIYEPNLLQNEKEVEIKTFCENINCKNLSADKSKCMKIFYDSTLKIEYRIENIEKLRGCGYHE